LDIILSHRVCRASISISSKSRPRHLLWFQSPRYESPGRSRFLQQRTNGHFLSFQVQTEGAALSYPEYAPGTAPVPVRNHQTARDRPGMRQPTRAKQKTSHIDGASRKREPHYNVQIAPRRTSRVMGLRAMRPSFRLLWIDDTILLSRGTSLYLLLKIIKALAIAAVSEIRLTVQARGFLVKGSSGDC
jgi:hypothetical protein